MVTEASIAGKDDSPSALSLRSAAMRDHTHPFPENGHSCPFSYFTRTFIKNVFAPASFGPAVNFTLPSSGTPKVMSTLPVSRRKIR